MKMYEGDKPCPGCGRTGKEEPRQSKDGLCRDCQESLRIGKAIVKEHELDRKYYLMDDLIKGQLTWYQIPIKEVDRALRNLLGQFVHGLRRLLFCGFKRCFGDRLRVGAAGITENKP